MYKISEWLLVIEANSDEEFFTLYDEAITHIPDTAFNKKWYRSARRTYCGCKYGLQIHIIGLNKPTLKKILQGA